MKNLLLRDDDSPRSRKKHFDPTSFVFKIIYLDGYGPPPRRFQPNTRAKRQGINWRLQRLPENLE
ncbi:hypothetical protein YC2023_054140 [Brassica napus]